MLKIKHGTLSGYQHYRCRCDECRKANADSGTRYRTKNNIRINSYHRKIRAERTERVRALMDVPCADCGNKFHPVSMDFDHVRGVKLFNIGKRAGSHALPLLLEEIAKCDIVCSNCHRYREYCRRQYMSGIITASANYPACETPQDSSPS